MKIYKSKKSLLLVAIVLLCIFFQSFNFAEAASPVTVIAQYPQNGDTIGAIYQNPGAVGTASSSGGSITGVALYIDGSLYSPASGTSNWSGSIDARFLSVGTHTFQVQATDSMGNTGSSTLINFTVFHVTPVCSHTLVGGSIYCESSVSNAVGTGTISLTYSSGHHVGDLMLAYAFGNLPVSPKGGLTNDITSTQTTFDVNPTLLGAWPATPFYATISDICTVPGCSYASRVTEKIEVTNITGNTFTVVRGVTGHGSCVPNFDYGPVEDEVGVIGGGTLVTCGGAAAHPAGTSSVNLWDLAMFPTNAVTNTAGDTWHLVGVASSGFGDYAVAPVGLWYAFAATTVSSDTITVNVPNDSAFIAAGSSIYSGVGTLDHFIEQTGVAGPTFSQAFAQTSSYASTPGDLNVAFNSGAPTGGLNGWNVRSADTSRPYTMSIDQYSISSTANAEFSVNTEGYYAWGLAFHPAIISVPNVVGLTQAAAATAITGAGVVVGTVTTASSNTVPSGSVISESPVSGSMVYSGSSVDMSVSTGPAAPVISSISSGTPGQTSATITWNTDTSADSQVQYGLTTGYGSSSSDIDTGGVTSHSITVSNLTAGTTYHYVVQSRDLSSQLSVSSDQIFTTATIPTPPPVTTGGNGAPSGSFAITTQAQVGTNPNPFNPIVTTLTTVSVSSLQSELTTLLAELKSLQTEQAQLSGTAVSSYANTLKQSHFPYYSFTQSLYINYVGPDVMTLQKLLNTLGFRVSASGPGSPGQETSKFGKATLAAVKALQTAVGLPATGFVGPMTRSYLNGLEK